MRVVDRAKIDATPKLFRRINSPSVKSLFQSATGNGRRLILAALWHYASAEEQR